MPNDVVPLSTFYRLACDHMDTVAELIELRERHQAAHGALKQLIIRVVDLETELAAVMGTDPWQREG